MQLGCGIWKVVQLKAFNHKFPLLMVQCRAPFLHDPNPDPDHLAKHLKSTIRIEVRVRGLLTKHLKSTRSESPYGPGSGLPLERYGFELGLGLGLGLGGIGGEGIVRAVQRPNPKLTPP